MKATKRAAVLVSMLAGVACGELSDPNRDDGVSVARVTGALTLAGGTSDLRVAIVWKAGNGGEYVVAKDAPVENGRFTIDVPPPPNEYLVELEADVRDPGATAAPPTSTPDPTGGGDVATASIVPLENVSGTVGAPSPPVRAANAGFVVYRDKNGNGRLDLQGKYLTSPDELVGGNSELSLRYLVGGNALAFEKLRDSAGVLPRRGFNLALGGRRWIQLDLAELHIGGRVKLPTHVCLVEPEDGWSTEERPYPPAGDPLLECSADGLSFTYDRSCVGRPGRLCSEGEATCNWTHGTSPPVDAKWPCPMRAEWPDSTSTLSRKP